MFLGAQGKFSYQSDLTIVSIATDSGILKSCHVPTGGCSWTLKKLLSQVTEVFRKNSIKISFKIGLIDDLKVFPKYSLYLLTSNIRNVLGGNYILGLGIYPEVRTEQRSR